MSPASTGTAGSSSSNPGGMTPNTAWLAVTRHQSGDFRPHLFRTRDLGESWERISGGIPESPFSFVHVGARGSEAGRGALRGDRQPGLGQPRRRAVRGSRSGSGCRRRRSTVWRCRSASTTWWRRPTGAASTSSTTSDRCGRWPIPRPTRCGCFRRRPPIASSPARRSSPRREVWWAARTPPYGAGDHLPAGGRPGGHAGGPAGGPGFPHHPRRRPRDGPRARRPGGSGTPPGLLGSPPPGAGPRHPADPSSGPRLGAARRGRRAAHPHLGPRHPSPASGGPLALPGTYTARVAAGEHTAEVTFEVLQDPASAGTPEEIAEKHEFPDDDPGAARRTGGDGGRAGVDPPRARGSARPPSGGRGLRGAARKRRRDRGNGDRHRGEALRHRPHRLPRRTPSGRRCASTADWGRSPTTPAGTAPISGRRTSSARSTPCSRNASRPPGRSSARSSRGDPSPLLASAGRDALALSPLHPRHGAPENPVRAAEHRCSPGPRRLELVRGVRRSRTRPSGARSRFAGLGALAAGGSGSSRSGSWCRWRSPGCAGLLTGLFLVLLPSLALGAVVTALVAAAPEAAPWRVFENFVVPEPLPLLAPLVGMFAGVLLGTVFARGVGSALLLLPALAAIGAILLAIVAVALLLLTDRIATAEPIGLPEFPAAAPRTPVVALPRGATGPLPPRAGWRPASDSRWRPPGWTRSSASPSSPSATRWNCGPRSPGRSPSSENASSNLAAVSRPTIEGGVFRARFRSLPGGRAPAAGGLGPVGLPSLLPLAPAKLPGGAAAGPFRIPAGGSRRRRPPGFAAAGVMAAGCALNEPWRAGFPIPEAVPFLPWRPDPR